MTMIVNYASPQSVLHVSDRRVTAARPNQKPSVHSPVENKTIIFLIRDAVGVVGYTGSAYIGDTPTDQWIAETLAPHTKMPNGDRFVASMGGRRSLRLNVLVWRLREALRSARLPPRARMITVSVAGYRIRRKYCVPFYMEISWPPSWKRSLFYMRMPSNKSQRILLAQVGAEMPSDELIEHIRGQAEAARSNDNAVILKGITEAVRTNASRTPLVGSDLMTVEIPNPNVSQTITWRFEPSSKHNGQIVGPGVQIPFDAVYSPWIITPGATYAPSIGTGHFDIGCGNWAIRCGSDEAHPGRRGLLFAVSSQQRLRKP